VTAACDQARTALALGHGDDAEALRHVATCDTCRADAPAWRALATALAAGRTPAPPSALAARVRAAAAPLLARHARAATWRAVAAAVAAAVLPLPLVLLIDGWLLRALYDTLYAVFPRALSLYVVVNYMTLLAVLLTLAYGAVPLLAERQARLRREERYG
jgi:anti-sigma factor RsiW